MTTGPSLRPVLALQLVFMLGFSSVVPFFAAIGQHRFGMEATAVGILVGTRILAQQGLFVVGGYLTDRFGPRRLLVAGCLLRALAFGTIAWAPSAPTFVLGVVLVGMAGALFSPAVDAVVGRIDAQRRSAQGHRSDGGRGPAPFAALLLATEAGGVIASLGAARVMPDHSAVVAALSAVAFLLAAASVHRLVRSDHSSGMPRNPPRVDARTGEPQTAEAATPVRVVPLAIACSALLAVYAQLFSTVPLALAEHGLDAGQMGWVAAALSGATLVLQWPLSRFAERVGRGVAVLLALGLSAAACLWAFAGQALLPDDTLPGVLCAVAVLVGLSMMLGTPSAQSLIAGGPNRWRATRLALLPSAGGAAAFLCTAGTGFVVETSGTLAAWPLAATLPLAMVPLAYYALRPTRRDPVVRHHPEPATAGSVTMKEHPS